MARHSVPVRPAGQTVVSDKECKFANCEEERSQASRGAWPFVVRPSCMDFEDLSYEERK